MRCDLVKVVQGPELLPSMSTLTNVDLYIKQKNLNLLPLVSLAIVKFLL